MATYNNQQRKVAANTAQHVVRWRAALARARASVMTMLRTLYKRA